MAQYKLRMRDRRSGADRRRCIMFVEVDRRMADRRCGPDRRKHGVYRLSSGVQPEVTPVIIAMQQEILDAGLWPRASR